MPSNNAIKNYVDRILAVMSEQDALGEDKKGIYKELAAENFDRSVVSQLVGYLRKKAKKPGKFAEQSQRFDEYLAAYEGNGTQNARAHAAREIATGALAIPHAQASVAEIQPSRDAADAEAISIGSSLSTSPAGVEGDADRQPIQEPSGPKLSDPHGSGVATREAATTEAPEPDPRTPIQRTYDAVQAAGKRQWKHSDPAHPDCLDPGMCGGFSNLARCERCKAAAGPVRQVEDAA